MQKNLEYQQATILRVVACFFFILVPAYKIYAQDMDLDAATTTLSKSQQWKRLLYYNENWYGKERSIVDSERFFLSPEGSSDPAAEMIATVKAFHQPSDDFENINFHPACMFPARLSWLLENLPQKFKKFIRPNCIELEKYKKKMNYEGVSLVFSSYYPDNPASLFGHSFIRLHKSIADNSTSNDLLDDSINFAGYPDTDNAILYPIRGLLGKFPGRFSHDPYYMKVQEYNNSERRDLWTYKLNLSQKQIDYLLLALWEIGPHHINYWYFDENCSFILLRFIEIAKPDITFRNRHPWVIPADTIRSVTDHRDFIKDVGFRASVLTRFRSFYQKLNKKEQATLEEMVQEDATPELIDNLLKSYTLERQASILDASIEYIGFKERLAGTATAKIFGTTRKHMLITRSKNKTLPNHKITPPTSERPDLAHEATRIGYGLVSQDSIASFTLDWRGALHDPLSNQLGYSPGLSIVFFDVNASYTPDTEKLTLDRYGLFEVLSVSTVEPLISTKAWKVSLRTERPSTCYSLGCYETSGEFGYGLGGNSKSAGLVFYAIGTGQLTYVSAESLFLQPGIESGITLSRPRFRLNFQLSYDRRFKNKKQFKEIYSSKLEGSYDWNQNRELRVGATLAEEKKTLFTIKYFYSY